MVKNHISSGQTYNPSTSQFLQDIFKAQAFRDGKTLKRSKASVKRFSSEEALIKAANNHGYDVYDMGLEYVLFPNDRELIRLDEGENRILLILEIADTPPEMPLDK